MTKQIRVLLVCTTISTAAAFSFAKPVQDMPPPATAEQSAEELAGVKIKQLKALLPDKPAVVNRETLMLMREIAITKRQDAAVVLVKALAFNFDPNNSDELRSLPDMIPAIGFLKDSFGESVAPLLYEEATSSDRKWYRDRIALAVRTILSTKTIKEMNARFSIATATDPKVKDFKASLEAKTLKVTLARPDAELLKRVGEAAERIRQRQADRPDEEE